MQEDHCNCPFLHLDPLDRCKISALSKQKRPSSGKLNYCKFKFGGSQKLQKWRSTKVECLDILNIINIKVAEFNK